MAMQGVEMSSPHEPLEPRAFDEVYVSIKGACARFGISRSGVYELIRQHRLKRYRRAFDSRTYVKVADLEKARANKRTQDRELIGAMPADLACDRSRSARRPQRDADDCIA
jgi:hypothetical protein